MDENYKVLHVCPYFLPSEGGSERAVYYICKELSKLGVPADVMTLNTLSCCVPSSEKDYDIFKLPRRLLAYRTARLPPEENFHGIKVWRFPYLGFGYSWTERARVLSLPMIVHFRSVVRHYSLVHFHTIGFLETSYILSLICRKNHIPYIVHVHGIFEFYKNYVNSHPLARVIVRCLLTRWLKNAARILAISPADLEILEKFNVDRNKIKIIPCGIDVSEFENIQEKYMPKKNKKFVNILYVGTIYPNKGLEVLIEALVAMDKSKLNRLKVDIVGDTSKFPSYVEKIEKMIKKYGLSSIVRFRGYVDRRTLLMKYRLADIYVRPSMVESFGITVLEAMASETPVIVTDVGGAKTFVKNGETGLLVPPGDSQRLREAMEKLIDNNELRKSLAKNGRKFVVAHFSWSIIAQRIKNIYDEILFKKQNHF